MTLNQWVSGSSPGGGGTENPATSHESWIFLAFSGQICSPFPNYYGQGNKWNVQFRLASIEFALQWGDDGGVFAWGESLSEVQFKGLQELKVPVPVQTEIQRESP